MKKLAICCMAASFLILFSCAEKPKVEEPKYDFLKVYVDTTPKAEPISTYTPSYRVTSMNTTPTYWYVVFDETPVNSKEAGTDWHRAIKLDTPYFDFIEAIKWLRSNTDVKGECYFDNIIQINKESFDSYNVYRREYFK